MRLTYKQQHSGPIHALKNTAIRLNITFKSAFGSKIELFSSHCGILQKEVSSGLAGNSMLLSRAASTIQTDVQKAGFRLQTLLQSGSVAPDVANGTAETLPEFCFAVYWSENISLLSEQSAFRLLADFWWFQ
jgi:hypothetical protein